MTSAAWVVRLLTPWRGRAMVSVALGAAAVCAAVALMMTSGYLISRAAERPPILDLMVAIVAVRFFAMARPALRYVERLVSHDVTFRLLLGIRRWFFEGVFPLAPARLAAYRAGDVLSRLSTEVESLQDVFLRVVSPAFVALIVGLVVVGTLAFVDGWLAFAIAVLLLLNGAIWPGVSTRWARGMGERRVRERSVLSAHLVATLQGAEDLFACGQECSYLAKAASHQAELDRLEQSLGRLTVLHSAVGSGLPHLGLWAALVLALPVVADGRLQGVWLAGLVLGVVAAFEAVEALPHAWLVREQLDDAARRVFAVVNAQPAVVDAGSPSAIAPGAAPAVSFSNVFFVYDHSAVLQGVSLVAPRGACVAIVGATGSGKSSLLSLVTRTWDPQRGSIELDGCDVRTVALADLRRAMAVMPQHVHIFDESLRDNLQLARPSASDAELRHVLQEVGLEQFLVDRPDGLDTRLGEHGTRMSAGERQRIGLARVMLTDAPLVLLDEPTANLDTVTERDVLRAIRRWARGRTLVIATHRLVDLETTDLIVVLEHGRIAEQGRHAELVSRDGPYQRLWLCQQGWLFENTT